MSSENPAYNLFAICRTNSNSICKRVLLAVDVQRSVTDLFKNQGRLFLSEVNEVPFSGSWKPDANELMTIDVPSSALPILDVANENAISVEDINSQAFTDENIKGLFVVTPDDGNKILVQRFTAQQILQRRFALVLAENTFNRMSDPAFTLDTSLTVLPHLYIHTKHCAVPH